MREFSYGLEALVVAVFKEAVQGGGLWWILYPEALGLVDRQGGSIVVRFMAGRIGYRPWKEGFAACSMGKTSCSLPSMAGLYMSGHEQPGLAAGSQASMARGPGDREPPWCAP
jgi:hypothetical protein